MASILAQFVRQRDRSITEVEECWKTYRETSEKPSSSENIRLLKAMRGHFSKAFVLVDALDEFPDAERRSLIRDLNTLAPTVQVLITSRYVPSIRSQLQAFGTMPIKARDEDVRIALAARILDAGDDLARVLKKDPTLHETIINAIIEKTKGMFLVAERHIAALLDVESVRDLHERLRNLPGDITASYKQTMERINGQKTRQSQRALQVLCWLAHARRPLEAKELEQALAIRDTDKKYEKDGEISTDTLLSYCMGLVVTGKQERETISGWLHSRRRPMIQESEWVVVVRFVHLTAQEYFDKFPEQIGLRGHLNIAETCISTLLLSDFDLDACLTQTSGAELDEESVESLVNLQITCPIVRYAAQHWGDHVRLSLEADSTSSIVERVQQLLQKRSNLIFSTWITHAREEWYLPIRHPDLSAPHLLAEFGLTQMLQRVFIHLEQGNVDVRDSSGRTPLHLACRNGHLSTMNTLLEHGADVNASSRNETRAIDLAIENGHVELVERLLEIGADMQIWNFLRISILNDQEVIVNLLLDQAHIEELERPLMDAVDRSQVPIVRKILRMMGDLSLRIEMMSKALMSAVGACSQGPTPEILTIIDLLLENGADPNHQHDGYSFVESSACTPLSLATKSLETVEYLVKRGALVNYEHRNGDTILHSRFISRECGQFFIDEGADVNKHNLLGRTPLHTAAGGTSEELCLFLESHAEVNVQDKRGLTPLHEAVFVNQPSQDVIVNISHLLRYGADVDVIDTQGYSPLHYAIFSGELAACKILSSSSKVFQDQNLILQLARLYDTMQRQATTIFEEKIGPQDQSSRKVFECDIAKQLDLLDQRKLKANKSLLRLVLPCQHGLDNVVRRFLEAGADCRAQASKAPLLTLDYCTTPSMDSSAMLTLKHLINSGHPLNEQYPIGSALSRAIQLGLLQTVSMLLHEGADPEMDDWRGSPLMMAASGGCLTRGILELLLQHRVDVNRACARSEYMYDKSWNPYMPARTTALHMCAASGISGQEEIRLLVSHGADLEARNEEGETPLTLAVRCGRPSTTAALLAEGADTTVSSALTRQDRKPGTYEVDFRKALRLVQEAHGQGIIVEVDETQRGIGIGAPNISEHNQESSFLSLESLLENHGRIWKYNQTIKLVM